MDDTMTRNQGGTPAGVDQKPVNLALQGGGAHGAFTWGVLDKLLEDGRLTIDAMSATSAGAMNAVVAAYGLSIDGPDGARRRNRW
jgi:NTE family protein